MSNDCFHVIFVDDDSDFLNSLNMTMSTKLPELSGKFELESHFVNSPQSGLDFIRELTEDDEKIALIISDQQMPQLTGIEFLERAQELAPRATKMLLTGYASLDSAKYAINHNILDQYISKPIEDHDNFAVMIKNALRSFYFREEKDKAELEVKKYIQKLEDSNNRIKGLHKAAERIAYLSQGFKKLDLDDVFDLIIERLPPVFGAQYASLFLLDSNDNTLYMKRSNYLEGDYKASLDADTSTPMMVALREDKVIVLPEIEEAPYKFLHKECLGNSCIIIPFIFEGEKATKDILGKSEEIRGVLNLGNIQDYDSEDVLQYSAALIKNIIGINILNAHLYQKTHRLAVIDSLTGLYNKFVFSEFLSKECQISERHNNSFYLAMMDLDDFKSINDNYGHLVGDNVLRQIGKIFLTKGRKSDIIARFGGEEFASILVGIVEEDAYKFLERIREEIDNTEFPNSIKLSISIGLTQYKPGSGDTVEKIINRADSALYKAKATGKNRIEVLWKDE